MLYTLYTEKYDKFKKLFMLYDSTCLLHTNSYTDIQWLQAFMARNQRPHSITSDY